MIYAPITIPTLNRYEHLKRCVESLQRNQWAKYTELYISLDYPSKESHWDGYNKIKEYLQQGIGGFKQVHVFYQEENLGAMGNHFFIQNKAFENYDRLIAVEDDNELSPNLIEYMNKGLELFENDSDIITIVGYTYDRNWNGHGGNVIKLQQTTLYAFAIWRAKWHIMAEEINWKLFKSIGRNPYYIWKLYHYSPRCLWRYVHSYLCDQDEKVLFDQDGNIVPLDIAINIYRIIKNKYAIAPVKSKVRNWGRDGSGANCGVDPEDHPEKFEIDQETSFEYHIPRPFILEEDNRLIQASINGSLKFKDNVKVLQNWFLREILGDKLYHTFLRKQKEYRQRKKKYKIDN